MTSVLDSVPTQRAGGAGELPRPLRLFLLWSVALSVLALLVLMFERHILHVKDYPGGYYLLSGTQFIDLTGFIGRFRDFHSATFFTSTAGGPYLYPPAVAPFYELLYLTGKPLGWFLVASLLLVLLFCALLKKWLRSSGWSRTSTILFVLLTVACSYVLTFEISRANMEIFLSTLCICGAVGLQRGRSNTAAICFGLAGAMKIYPLIYLGLLISQKRYKAFFLGLGACALVTVASLWAICPDVKTSFQGVRQGLRTFGGMYSLSVMQLQGGVDHSGFNVVKHMLDGASHVFLQRALVVYMGTAAVGLLCLYFWRMRKLPLENQLICFACAAALVPPTSFEYTLLQLYMAWVPLVLLTLRAYRTSGRGIAGLSGTFICFAFVFSDLSEILWRGNRIEGCLKAFVLATLFVIALRYPFQEAPALNAGSLLEQRS